MLRLAGLLSLLPVAAASLIQSHLGCTGANCIQSDIAGDSPCVVNGDCFCSSNYAGSDCTNSSTILGTTVPHQFCTVTFTEPVILSAHLVSGLGCASDGSLYSA